MPDTYFVSERNQGQTPADQTRGDSKVVNLAYYRIKRSLQREGFDLVTDNDGKLKLVLRVTKS